MKIVVWLGLSLSSFSFATENSKCEVPHHPLRWQAAYCMTKAETDDFEAINGSKCMEEKSPASEKTDCAKNAYWKKKWCSLVKELRGSSSVESCLKNRKMEPSGVAEGF